MMTQEHNKIIRILDLIDGDEKSHSGTNFLYDGSGDITVGLAKKDSKLSFMVIIKGHVVQALEISSKSDDGKELLNKYETVKEKINKRFFKLVENEKKEAKKIFDKLVKDI